MAKHFGEESLVQLLTLVKNKIDILLNKIEAKQERFIVTATGNLTEYTSDYSVSGTLTGLSHTFAQIEEAYLRGDNVSIDVDCSQINEGLHSLLNLSLYQQGGEVGFAQIAPDSSGGTLITAIIEANGGTQFTFETLAMQSQLNGLTLKRSSSEPEDDDPDVITFVIEG